jgi:hypothetical protein
MHLMLVQQQQVELHLHHVLLHVLLHDAAVLHLLFVGFSMSYLVCARTVRSDSERRGRLGGRIPELSSRFLRT